MKAPQARGQISPSGFDIGMLPYRASRWGAAGSTGHRETTWIPCVLLLTAKREVQQRGLYWTWADFVVLFLP